MMMVLITLTLATFYVFVHGGMMQEPPVVKHVSCSSQSQAVILERDKYHHLLITSNSSVLECHLELISESGVFFELMTLTDSTPREHRSCPPGYFVEPYSSSAGALHCPKPRSAACPVALIGDYNGFASSAALTDYREPQPPLLVSNSHNLIVSLCQRRSSQVNAALKLRTVSSELWTVAGPSPLSFSSPWFPAGYIQAAQTYTYRFDSYTPDHHFYTHILVEFDDLDLTPGTTIQVADVTLVGRNRKSIYHMFDDSGYLDVIVKVSDLEGRWTSRLGWKFTVKYVNETVDYYSYDYDNIPLLGPIETKSTYYDLGHSLTSQRLQVTVEELQTEDHLFVFSRLPEDIKLSVHVTVFTQNFDDIVIMEIRDGVHSRSRLVANVTSSQSLSSSQPKFGYVLSSGAYIRVRGYQAPTESILTVIVTPFRIPVRHSAIPDQCCSFPREDSYRGGFMCTASWRCIPADSACDLTYNCGNDEDEDILACRGTRYESYGMTARNMCRSDAKTVLCPWGMWVRDRADCVTDNRGRRPSTTVLVGSLMGVLGVLLAVLSLFYKRKIAQRRAATERNQREDRRLRRLQSRLECDVLPRSVAGSSEVLTGSRSELRLQMGRLPPAYEDIHVFGKPPPAYRENAAFDRLQEDDNISMEQPPAYLDAITHPKADELPSLQILTHNGDVTNPAYYSSSSSDGLTMDNTGVTMGNHHDVITMGNDVTTIMGNDMAVGVDDRDGMTLCDNDVTSNGGVGAVNVTDSVASV